MMADDKATNGAGEAEAKPKTTRAKAAPKAQAEPEAPTAAATQTTAKAGPKHKAEPAEPPAPAKAPRTRAATPAADADEPAVEAPKTTRRAAKADAPDAGASKAPAKAASKAPAKAASKAAAKGAQTDDAKAVASQGHGGTLRVHHLRPAPGAHKRKIRVGRGEGSKGKTAGRGTKGTKARYQVPARFEGGQTPLHMRLPKLRGFRNPFRVEYQVVNLDKLTMLYPDGGAVTVADLVAKGAVRKGWPVKVLGDGEVGVKLEVDVDALSASAREKILAAGGSVANG